MVVIAASRRSRQRPSPLRGGRGGGLCPFVVVTAEVFLHRHKNNAKKMLHTRLPPFLSQVPAWGLRLFAALAPSGEIFGEVVGEKNKTSRKKATSTGRGRWSCGGLRRAALEVTAVFCGHGRWFFLESFLGFSIWRLKRHNLSFASVAAQGRPAVRVDPGTTTGDRPGSGATESSLMFGRLGWPWVKGKFISREFLRIKPCVVCGLVQISANSTQHTTQEQARSKPSGANAGNVSRRIWPSSSSSAARAARGGRTTWRSAASAPSALRSECFFSAPPPCAIAVGSRSSSDAPAAAAAATPSPPPVSSPPVSAISAASEPAFASPDQARPRSRAARSEAVATARQRRSH